MTKTIFRNTFLVGLSVLLLCSVLFFAVRYSQTLDEAYEMLKNEGEYMQAGLMTQGVEFLEMLRYSDRVTWIAADGRVIYDNMYGTAVENQLEFAEVQEALVNGSGNLVRYSGSGREQTLYYAIKCPDGTVIRLSRPLKAVQNALNFISPVIWILVIVLVISGVLAYRAARQIVRPINNIDLEHPDIGAYPELAPLIEKIQEQRLTIQDEAASREQMRREFTANVSHELKTPLTSISGFAELMANGAVPPEEMPEFAGDIYKESQRMIALINDIIKLSQLDEDAFADRFTQVDLYQIVSEVVQRLGSVAQKKDVRLSLTGQSACIQGVGQLLEEMVYNLCDNAIKYNHPHGSVTMEVNHSDDRVILTVADTGIGIPKEHQDRIFERFYRVDKSHSREIGGTGLGLSIVKHVAIVHNAKVEMESEPGQGTCIKIQFPFGAFV